MSSQAPIRTGIIGLGKMGQTRARVLEACPDAELVCGYDPRPHAFTQEFPEVRLTDRMEDVLNAPIDAVFVCTPNRYTPNAVIAALDAGKHVFCEKPPGRSIADIQAIIDAEQSHPELKLAFGFNHRYHAGIQEAKRIIESGRLGRILWLRGIYGKSGGPHFDQEWRSRKDLAGAGILLDQGIHMLDLFRYFCGDFAEVKSMVTTALWDIDVEDNAFALLRDTQGRIALLHSSSTHWKHRFTLEIFMSDGYLSVNGILTSTRSYGDETISVARKQFLEGMELGKPREEIIFFDTDPSWEHEVAEFLQHIRDNTPVESGTSEQALKAMELVFAIYRNDPVFMASNSAPENSGT